MDKFLKCWLRIFKGLVKFLNGWSNFLNVGSFFKKLVAVFGGSEGLLYRLRLDSILALCVATANGLVPPLLLAQQQRLASSSRGRTLNPYQQGLNHCTRRVLSHV